ncbi:sodium-dependent neutral amino acid transporter SLC6A17-like [Tachypleus tridentatus]|uniref:sodium-dependent neutral amino acid transporter SLC6A17-like n=1 Tax=Tachypleus tridentatus TaxID=6853 RepID=UPI003FD3188D
MELSLCLLLAWFLVYLVILKGLQSSGKIIKVSAVTPYVIRIILLIRGVMLEGAGDGLLFYITPKFDKFLDPKRRIYSMYCSPCYQHICWYCDIFRPRSRGLLERRRDRSC